MIDTRKRSFTKAVIWKVLGLTVLTLVAFIITGSIKQTGFVAIVYHFLMLCLFVLHERVWNSISWGRTKGLFIQMTGMSAHVSSIYTIWKSHMGNTDGRLIKTIEKILNLRHSLED